MEFDYTFFYVESNVVCQIIFLMLFLRSLRSVDRQMKNMMFDNVLIGHILYFASDIAWILVESGYLPKNRFSVSAVNYTNAIFLLVIAFYWFMYVEMSQGETYLGQRINRFYVQIPLMLSFFGFLYVFVFHNDLLIDIDLKPTMLYSVWFMAVPIVYVLLAVIRSLVRAMLKENYMFRKQYILSGIYPFVIMVFGVLQTLWLTAPLFCFGCTVSMIYMYLLSQDDLISLDPLTGLNNRAQLKKYVTQEFSSRDGIHYVLMIDLNRFKAINDDYGHLEGDRAIIRAANALKQACNDYKLRPFICRYGGDEFIIILKTDSEGDVIELRDRIIKQLDKANKEARTPYTITASIGYARCEGDSKVFQEAVNNADKYLYRAKKISHFLDS